MKNYIKGEIYKLLRRKAIWIFYIISIVILTGMRIGLPVVNNVTGASVLTSDSVMQFSFLIMIGINALILIFIPIFTDDLKNGTLKNYATVDISIKQVFLGKIIVQIGSALLLLAITLPLLMSIIDILPSVAGYNRDAILELTLKIILSLPCFITSLLVADFLALVIKNEIMICLAYYYGYIQVFAFLVFAGCNETNSIISAFILPMQMAKLFCQKLTVYNGVITMLTGVIYCAVTCLLLKNQLDKKAAYESLKTI